MERKRMKLILALLIVILPIKAQKYVGSPLLITGLVLTIPNLHGFSPMDGEVDQGDRGMLFSGLLIASGVIINEDYDYLHLSTGLDLRNVVIGGTVNERAYDGIFRFYYKNKFQVGFIYEYFPDIEFDALSLQLNHVYKWVSYGVLLNSIYNQQVNVFSLGCNVELTTKTYKGLSISLLSRYNIRPELSKFGVYSNYLTLNYKI